MTNAKALRTDELEALREGCEGATPGPWVHGRADDKWTAYVEQVDGVSIVWPSERATEPETGFVRDEDAAHIARCDPDTIRALATECLEARTLLAQIADIASGDKGQDNASVEILKLIKGTNNVAG